MPAQDTPKLQKVVDEVIGRMIARGLIVARNKIDWTLYDAFAADIHRTFEIPSTTITPVMRRLLFGIGTLTLPRTVLSLGSHVGYCPVWLAGRSISDPQLKLIGVDTDATACRLFNENFSRLAASNLTPVSICGRAEEAVGELSEQADVILIDVDDPLNGKNAYPELFRIAARRVRPEALVLLHDSAVPKFRKVFEKVAQLTTAVPCSFKAEIPIDDCGILIFQRGVGA